MLDGFSITNGVHEKGSGIHINNSSPTIVNCKIDQNMGVGIYGRNTDVVIKDTSIIRNQGTGIYFIGDNDSGNIRIGSFNTKVINSTISDNKFDGIVSFLDIRTMITDSKITKNTRWGVRATSFGGYTDIMNCEISQNTGGGLECSEFSKLTIYNSIIKENTGKIGGAIYAGPSGRLEVTKCLIIENKAQRGGGIGVVLKFDGPIITNCTISQNTSEERGGGIYANLFGAHLKLSASIVWENKSNDTHNEIFGGGPSITIKNSDIKDGLEGFGVNFAKHINYEDNIDVDPLFVDPDRGNYNQKMEVRL
ncbi:right-handed parallel beta-helix repeat-containing protein [Candidatus Poribacteria bacterium]|nr:right-handed parallel beta-helix repeat-containing protein [Candidatus Poribacteria bacterium]